MGPKEKYNAIIDTIEELVLGKEENDYISYLDEIEINESAFKKAECSDLALRERNVLFLFLNKMTVLEYINQRKIMAVGKNILSADRWDKSLIDQCIEMAGVGDDKAFAKKFKKHFKVSPKKAFEDRSIDIIPKRDWESIEIDNLQSFVILNEDNEMQEYKFGIEKEKYIRAQAAMDLQSFYMLNDIESNIAFELFSANKFSIEECFKYVYNYVGKQDRNIPCSKDREQIIKEDLLNEDVIYLYFECNLGFNDILYIIYDVNQGILHSPLKNYEKRYLLGYSYYIKSHGFLSTFNAKYDDVCKYFDKNTTDEYTYYDFILFVRTMPILGMEKALRKIKPGNDAVSMSKRYKVVISEAEYEMMGSNISNEELYMEMYDDSINADDWMEEREDDEDDEDDLEFLQNMYSPTDEHIYDLDDLNEWNDFNQFCDILDSESEINFETNLDDNRMLELATQLNVNNCN